MAHSEAEIKVAIRTVVWNLWYFDVRQVQEAVILMFVKGSNYLQAYQPVGESHFVTGHFQKYSIVLEITIKTLQS